MKILYFTNKPAPYRVEFFNRLNKDHDLTVIFNKNNNDFRNKEWYAENKYNFKVINLSKHALVQLNKILNEKFDIVVIGTYASKNAAIFNILLRLKNVKFFINADGGFIVSGENIFSKIIKKVFLSGADYYLSSGLETNKYLEYYGAKKDNIFIYPFTSLRKEDILSNQISYNDKIKLRKKSGYDYSTLFISVGSFIERKGYDLFLKSIKDYSKKDTGFIIVGGGPLKKEYEEYMIANNINNVHLVDFCSKKDVFNYYKMSDVFFFPSREDIWGLVINEAMACGLPIISSDKVISAIELLNRDSIYSCNNINQLRSKIMEYDNKSKHELYEIGAKNLEKISNYTIENMVNEHIKIFNDVLIKK